MKAMKGSLGLILAPSFTRYRLIHRHHRKKMKGLNPSLIVLCYFPFYGSLCPASKLYLRNISNYH